jgi:hypothetical protein
MSYAVVIIFTTRNYQNIADVVVFTNDQEAADYFAAQKQAGKPVVLSKAYGVTELPEHLKQPPIQEPLL